jgi:nicotinate-nucleotide adenylyltransferase
MSDKRPRICLFGGSFDPPHVAHLMATSWALATLRVDAVWWVPAWQHAFGKNLSPFEQRLGLCQLAIRPFGDFVHVSDIEEQLGGESRTIDTIEALRLRHPNTDWVLLLGSDIIPQTRHWKQWDRVQQLAEVVVIGRSGHGETDPAHDVVLPNISSSSVRDALTRGDAAWLQRRVPAAVLDKIASDGLYR